MLLGEPGKLLIVGQAPEAGGDGLAPCTGFRGKRLAQLFGLSEEEMRRQVCLAHLLQRFPGRGDGRMDDFPAVEARMAAAQVQRFASFRVLLLGAVATAFGCGRSLQFVWFPLRGAQVAVVPDVADHNWWRDASNAAVGSKFFSELLLKVAAADRTKGANRG